MHNRLSFEEGNLKKIANKLMTTYSEKSNDQIDFIWNNFNYQMNVAMIILDLSGNFISLNANAAKIYKVQMDDLVGKPFSTVLDPFSHDKATLMIERTIKEGKVLEWELDHTQPEGPPILLGYTTTAIQDDSGNKIAIGAIGIDQTTKLNLTDHLAQTNQVLEGTLLKLEKTFAELKETQTQLVHSEKMRSLGTLVAGIAHEINNPAAFVMNNLSSLKQLVHDLEELFTIYQNMKKMVNEEEIHYIQQKEKELGIDYIWQDLKDITSESIDGMERIRKIILSLRTFSHLDEAEFKLLDITDGLKSTVQLIRSSCKNRIEIIEKYEKIPPINCRPGELNQVFLNLLSNSVQSIENKGKIEISAYQENKDVIIKITDNGYGMNAKTMERLGEPFFTTKPVGSGTGLGLSISFGIIERHNGTILFESVEGKGTTTFVKIPIQ